MRHSRQGAVVIAITCSKCEAIINTDYVDDGEYDGSSTGYTCGECLEALESTTEELCIAALKQVVDAFIDERPVLSSKQEMAVTDAMRALTTYEKEQLSDWITAEQALRDCVLKHYG